MRYILIITLMVFTQSVFLYSQDCGFKENLADTSEVITLKDNKRNSFNLTFYKQNKDYYLLIKAQDYKGDKIDLSACSLILGYNVLNRVYIDPIDSNNSDFYTKLSDEYLGYLNESELEKHPIEKLNFYYCNNEKYLESTFYYSEASKSITKYLKCPFDNVIAQRKNRKQEQERIEQEQKLKDSLKYYPPTIDTTVVEGEILFRSVMTGNYFYSQETNLGFVKIINEKPYFMLRVEDLSMPKKSDLIIKDNENGVFQLIRKKDLISIIQFDLNSKKYKKNELDKLKTFSNIKIISKSKEFGEVELQLNEKERKDFLYLLNYFLNI